MNTPDNQLITVEQNEHCKIVDQLAAQAFGPGRFTRTAFRLREDVRHEKLLSFVCWKDEQIVASVRLTKILVGEKEALLLGPLVVSPDFKTRGHGAELMRKAVGAAWEAEHSAIILVGDLPYYQRFGFERVRQGSIIFPGPVDPARLLICKLKLPADQELSGQARPYS